MISRLVALGILVLSGCATRAPSLHHVNGDHYTVSGLEFADMGAPVALAEARATLASVSGSCPQWDEDLMFIDCREEPCLAHVWAAVGGSWSDLTCGSDLQGHEVAQMSVSLDDTRMISWRVLAFGDGVASTRESTEASMALANKRGAAAAEQVRMALASAR